ncbi:MAG: DegT/DnrJ/EryC1/StrS family aminotransferase [Sphaerochaetaceae bacterium]|nr:DegT/DnrJ/EryC1/StrS family aminotransferase [Sphaerochaetaceae bacterium]
MIRFYKPTLKRKDMDSVLQTMVDEEIGPSRSTKAFTELFSSRVKCSRGLSFRTYPDCIDAALKALGVGKESCVAISMLSPSVYLSALEKTGCRVVYVDADRENGLADEKAVMESGADVLILYESCGMLPIKYNRETTFAEKVSYEGIKILEDVSESLGSYCGEEFAPGDWGSVVVSSFEEENIVSCAGGAALAVKKGFECDLEAIRDPLKSMTDLNASLGLVQLQNLDVNCGKNREIGRIYTQKVLQTRHRAFGLSFADFNPSYSSFSVFLDSKPEDSIKFAEKNGVPVKKTFADSICSVYGGDLFGDFPVCAAYYYRTVSFPVYPFLKNTEIDLVGKVIGHLL